MAIVKRYKYEKDENNRWVKAAPAVITGYQVVVTRQHPDTGKRQRKIVKSFPAGKWKLAQAENKKAEADVLAGVFEWEPKSPEPETIIPTVEEACETWMRIKALDVSANHLLDLKSALKNHVVPAWGDRLVTELTHDQIQDVVLDWATEIEDERKAKHPQTIHRALTVLSGALDRQLRSGVINANPALGVRKPSVKKGKKHVPSLNTEQVEAFFKAASGHALEPLFWLGELEGMRRAEILGARWGDVRGLDSDGPVVLSVSQTNVGDKNNGGRPLLQQKAKTRGSERAILLVAATVEALKRHRDSQRFKRKAAGDLWVDNDLILCNEIGEPLRPDSVSKTVKKFLDELGLDDTTLHGLRHHALTRLLRQGVSPALAAQKAGHSDVGLVYRTYGHLIQSDQSAANEAIERELKAGS